MQITVFPYDFTYKQEGKNIFVYSFAKTLDGEQIVLKHKHEPYFYAAIKNIKRAQLEERLVKLEIKDNKQTAKVIRIEEEEKELLGDKQNFLKIFTNYPKAVPLLAKEIESWDVTCYERDILFVHRYLRDTKIIPFQAVEVTGERQDNLILVDSLKPKQSEKTPEWNVLAVDIETYAKKKEIDPHKNPILMIALYSKYKGKETKLVLTHQEIKGAPAYTKVFDSEKAMLEAFVTHVKENNPDIITGYFSDGFDFPYIATRAERLKVNLNLGKDGSSLRIMRAGFDGQKSLITGFLHIDVLNFIKRIFFMNLATNSYKLDNVAHELLDTRKVEVNLEELAPAWDNKSDKLKKFVEYNLYDAKITQELCLLLLPDMIEFTAITGLPLYDVTRMRYARLVESYIMKRASTTNVLSPNKPAGNEIEERMSESVQGAFVYEPTPGIYKDLVVFDFKSLYPTIITAHNIGPEGLCKPVEEKYVVPGREQYWFPKNEQSFIPHALEELIKKRQEIKKQIKGASPKEKKLLNARSYALKILANSFYGYLGFYGARWYCLECAAATTAFARHYIKQTIEQAEQEGFLVVYGDTDSCFFTLGEKTKDDAMSFMKKVNKKLPGMMELEFEGYFPRALFVAQKGSERGAKKRYALKREDGSLKITGFEVVRRNVSPIAKEAQKHVLDLVLSDKSDEARSYIKELVRELESGKIPLDKLIITTQLTRALSKYKARGPHVVVAERLAEMGEPVHAGMQVRYIIGKGKGLVRERAQIPHLLKPGEYDAEYYIKNQVLPAVDSLFALLELSEEEMLGKAKQTGLSSFMSKG